ncbi:anthranilate synthase component I family protein [Pontibacter sp. JH31]|uniref:Anthranilate synthase component I family protein n=1 Tax=Pontibacter aquaedesilientis TaxID=2766980 RepID=A0ABR7XD91_9BACT|nr:anthranilate synthase component I family protein [Pontibacter aquaedesilientis]MBD1396260.1 anthranilate synthase component I family protein [Pontibacter aquaedesilientis]
MSYNLTLKAENLPVSLTDFRQRALAWANELPLMASYTSNDIPYPYHGFDELLAVSSGAALPIDQDNAFESLQENLDRQQTLWCGFLAYDLKNQIEKLTSDNPDHVGFPSLFFFEPELYLYFEQEEIRVYSQEDNIAETIQQILNTAASEPLAIPEIQLQQRVSREDYIRHVERVRQHILEGDVYELNYCMEFYAEQVTLSPLPLYLALNAVSPTPFSGYLKYHDRYLLCASPERYLKKEDRKLISQPIKGTIRRGATPAEDLQLQQQLRHDEKELAENMMIVDLVRNDLRRSCTTGTIQVEEMFGIYGFRQVSQMISTISGQLRPECDIVDALKGTFPMGSMTGAPKIRSMEIIEELEATKRGLYSGAFGYIKPNQDFDLNVVIRSLQYNATTGYLSFMVGSAITYEAIPEKEYEECLLKARAILQVLGLK